MIDEERVKIIREAAKDLRYLLNRGYGKTSSLKIVGDRYGLDKKERLILFRGILPKHDADLIRSRKIDACGIRGKEVWVDGFNVLHTIEAVIKGDLIVLGDDGVIRDVSGIHGKYSPTKSTERALQTMINILKEVEASYTVILYESQISRSGEIAALTRRILKYSGVRGEARTSKTVDSELVKSGKIVATSDSIILLRCNQFFDIPGYLVSKNQIQVLKL